MNADERYLFDLNGYLVVRSVLNADEVAECNAAIDHHIDQLKECERSGADGSDALGGTEHRHDMPGMLRWEKPWREPFRRMLAHPNIVSYLNGVLGEGYRLDHGPGLIAQNKGAEGGTLHHGGADAPDFSLSYFFKNDRIYTGLSVVEYMLADEGPGDGGLAVIPASHKANLSCPQEIKRWEAHREHVLEVNTNAGDAVIFTETLTHGTLPWTAEHQRRALLYKFSPGVLAFSGGAHSSEYPDYIDEMEPGPRAVMEAPHYRR